MTTHPSRWIGHLIVLMGAATACVPSTPKPEVDAGSGPPMVCLPTDAGGVACTCTPTFELGPTGQCRPSFSVLRVNGVEAPRQDLANDEWLVDVPRGTNELLLEVATESPGYAPIIDGAFMPGTLATRRLSFAEPERRVIRVDLARDSQLGRRVRVVVRRAPRYRVVARVECARMGSVALTGDGHFIAGGSPTFSFSSHNGGSIVSASDDGGLDPVEPVGPASDTLGWTVAISDDARVLASANPSSPQPLSVFERGAVRWEPVLIEGLPDGGGTGAVAMTRDGRHVLFSTQMPGGPVTISEATPEGPGRWRATPVARDSANSLALSVDGALAAAGEVPGGVQLFARQGLDLVPTARLRQDAGTFGSSLAMSDDGAVLAVSARSSTAWIYERTDAGFVERAKVVAQPSSLILSSDSLAEAPVSVSGNGERVAVGFPAHGTVAIVARADGGWAVIDWVHVPNEDAAFFGNGVSLSADGRRLGLASWNSWAPSRLLFLEDSER